MPIGGITYDVQIELTAGVWTSLGADPQEITIERGRSDDLAETSMGRCTVRLHDHTGKYAAEQATSPLYPNLRPMKGVRVRATYLTVVYPLFRGFLSRCETNPDIATQEAVLEAVDLFYKLGQVSPVIAPLADTTTGAAIGAILDAIGWTDPTLRDLDVGDTLALFSADGSTSALALIGGLSETERGQFYVNGSGVATYENRHARSQSPRNASQATVSAALAVVTPGIDAATIRNRATVTATGGTPQTASDAASVAEFGPSAFGDIASDYLATDAQALSLGAYMVLLRKDPLPTVRRLRLDAIVDTARIPMLQREIGDRITAVNALTGVSGDHHIEKIAHAINVTDMDLRTDWTLTKRSATTSPFLIQVSAIGGTDVITY